MNAEKTAKRFMKRVSQSCTGMNPQREFELLNQLVNIIEAAQHSVQGRIALAIITNNNSLIIF